MRGRISRETPYLLTQKFLSQFDQNSILFTAWEIADETQRTFFDFLIDLLNRNALRPEYVREVIWLLEQRFLGAVESVGTPAALWSFLFQLRNILTVVGFVNQAGAPETVSRDGTYPLAEQIAAAYSTGPYQAVWAVEGLGQNYAIALLKQGPAKGLLTSGAGAAVPEQSLFMLHAGIGITFARLALTGLTPYSGDRKVTHAVAGFLQQVSDNARPGYEGPVMESLGLVTRTWFKAMTGLIGREVARQNPVAAEYFWHGAGRSMYFSPINMLPGFSPWLSAATEPPDEISRRNARAGAAWAATIVNMRQPFVLTDLISANTRYIAMDDSFTSGAVSSLAMVTTTVPGDSVVANFLQQSRSSGKVLDRELLRRFLGADVQAAVAQRRASVFGSGDPGSLFRWAPSANSASAGNIPRN